MYRPRHLLGVPGRTARRIVIGRLFWGPGERFPSPWVSFANLTAYRTWAREVRRARPGTKTEMAYLDAVQTASTLLDAVRGGVE